MRQRKISLFMIFFYLLSFAFTSAIAAIPIMFIRLVFNPSSTVMKILLIPIIFSSLYISFSMPFLLASIFKKPTDHYLKLCFVIYLLWAIIYIFVFRYFGLSKI